MKIAGVGAVCAVLVLAGCGSSSSSSNLSFSELEATGNNLLARTEPEFFENYTPLNQLPRSGSADYEGIVTIADPNFAISSPALVGQGSGSLNFRSETFAGSASNFFTTDSEQRLAGALDLSGELDRTVDLESDYSIVGDMTGTLSGPGGDIVVDIPFQADSYRTSDQFLFGIGRGTITVGNTGPLTADAGYLFDRTDD